MRPIARLAAPPLSPGERLRPQASGRLIVASNRLPFTARRTEDGVELAPSAGGLVTAMRPALEARGGAWIGWLGHPEDHLILPPLSYDVRPIALTAEEEARYYDGFSNQTLWPLFHSLVQEASFDEADWRVYEAVNERFARALTEAWRPGDVAWIHDYHLLRVPHHLRRLGFQGEIAFFLHVPFPHVDILRSLPWAKEILDGLLACDLAGFHLRGYADNFLGAARELRGARVEGSACAAGSRRVQVGAFPIGIDASAWERLAAPAVNPARKDLRIILGVDRLDYTKGIPQRLLAYERFLERHPEQHGKVQMLQLAVPSRDEVDAYRKLKRTIDELVGRIDGRFATPSWSPLRYLHRSLPPKELAALYRHADVMLVTPLRDGMNLVAKEFVACQGDDPGVLVLSSLAGAADGLKEALVINPHDIDDMADAIGDALAMPADERVRRMRRLQERVRGNDVHRWAASFLEAAARHAHEARLNIATPELDGRHVTLLLDFDGTLAPIAEHPSSVELSPRTRKLLVDCSARTDTRVVILSGRALADLRERVDVHGAILGGNHGLEIEGPGIGTYVHEDLACFAPRIRSLADRLDRIVRHGAWVERKGASLTVHLRAVPASERRQMQDEITALIAGAGLLPRPALLAVEARAPIAWDKGLAGVHVLRTLFGPDWPRATEVVAAGDDATDEDLFQRLGGLGSTFRIGIPGVPTAARRVIERSAVDALLERVATRPRAAVAAQAG